MNVRWTDDALRIAGRVLIVLGAVCLVCLVIIVATGEYARSEKSASAAKGFIMFASLFLLPGCWMHRVGCRMGEEDDRMALVASMMSTYRRIAIADAARKLGWTEWDVERMFAACVQRGIVKGNVDRTTQELFTEESLSQETTPADLKCSQCGARLDGRFLKGETVVCPYCQARLG